MTPATQTEEKPAPGNMPDAKTHGPYRRYSVNYGIDPAGLTFMRTPDGKIHSEFDLVIFVFNPDDVVINSQVSRVRITATLDEVKQMFGQGIYRHEEISAPAKGEYFFRIAVNDQHRDRYGAVEVATSQVKNLVLATTPSPIPAAPITK